jgi:hypothetical protein
VARRPRTAVRGKGVPQRVQPDTADAQSLGRGADRPQPVPGVDCRPALPREHEARLNPGRGRLDPLDRLARLDPPKSATVAGERGTLRRERSVLGSLMTRCPLARESVPRTRRRPLVGSTSDQRRPAPHPHVGPWRRAGAAVAHTVSPSPHRAVKRPRQWTGSAPLSLAHLAA